MQDYERIAAKTAVMLAMQDEMNRAVDPDWLARGREWYRAIWIECAELMDHYGGWKWWKHSEPDYRQALLEIVDIWHFGLSLRIRGEEPLAETARGIAGDWFQPSDSRGFLEDVERLAECALAERRFEVALIPALLRQLGCGFDDLYSHYVGKNVLNGFRQEHGYRDGRYQKRWQGREDNEHLSEILAELDCDSPGYRERIHARLRERYAAACD